MTDPTDARTSPAHRREMSESVPGSGGTNSGHSSGAPRTVVTAGPAGAPHAVALNPEGQGRSAGRLDPADVRRATALLEAIVADRGLLVDLPQEERVALLMAAGRASRPTREHLDRQTMARRRAERRRRKTADREARACTGIRETRAQKVFLPPPRRVPPEPGRDVADDPSEHGRSAGRLSAPRHCYVCKEDFVDLHFFYDSMCPTCAETNYEKRFQSADLRGRVAVVTGARVKIGYQAALMLLRAGANVVVTTRFPHDAAARYAREADYAAWSDRLHVHGLDLRHVPSVELFAKHLNATFDRLDFLVNNAAQTVRRPAGWYAHLIRHEARCLTQLDPRAQRVLQSHGALKAQLVVSGESAAFHLGLTDPAMLSQVPLLPEDRDAKAPELFPEGVYDQDLQQVDRRPLNSWRYTLADVPTPELIEVQLVNSIAPFLLCAHLKALMLRVPSRDKHIVNVTAMEGIFSRGTKTDKHPHTNMAKAALNMMTLTSAPDYLKDGIHMNAVDTGWVTDEDPIGISTRKQQEHDFQPPLDIVDGAARILDPIFGGLNSGVHIAGKFLKDYKVSAW